MLTPSQSKSACRPANPGTYRLQPQRSRKGPMFSSNPSQTQSVSSPVGKGTQRETLMPMLQRIQKGPYIQFSPSTDSHGEIQPTQEPLCLQCPVCRPQSWLRILKNSWGYIIVHCSCSRAMLLNQRPIQGLGRNLPRDLLGATPIPTTHSRSTDWIPNSGLWNRNLPKCHHWTS